MNVKKYVVAVLGLWLIAGITFYHVPNNTFVLDDDPNIVENTAIHIETLTIHNLISVARGGLIPLRVIPNLSFAIDWWRGKGTAKAFLETNIIIHLINGFMVFVLVNLVIAPMGGLSQHQCIIIAFFCALLWLIHPAQLQGVTYIVQRMTTLASFFMLASIIAYLYARGWAKHKLILFFSSLVFFICAVLSKENAAIVPILLILVEYGIYRNHQRLIQYKVDYLVLLLPVIVLIYLVFDYVFDGPLFEFVQSGYVQRYFTLEDRLISQPRVIFFYLSQLLWPLPWRFSIEHNIDVSLSLFNPVSTFFSLVVLVLICALGLRLLFIKGQRVLGGFILWYPIAISIESSFFALELVFEHRAYFPNIGLFLLVAVLIRRLLLKIKYSQSYLIAISSVLAVLLMMSTLYRIPLWQSKLLLYEQSADLAPNNLRANYNYANALMEDSQFDKAIRYYEKANSIWPYLPSVHLNLANAYFEKLEYQNALSHLADTINIDPKFTKAYYLAARIYTNLGDHDQAIKALQTVLQQKPEYAQAYNDLGYVYAQSQRELHSLHYFKRAIELNPTFVQAYINLGINYAKLNRFNEAIESFKKALQFEPLNANIYNNLGIIYTEIGNYNEARRQFEKALIMEPNLDIVRKNLDLLQNKVSQ